ncbi:hypothetical protein K435DRAFT_858150 [Dendrothele bispora CBS 962.96]|uniref:Uncharacterized protein n=1 Tax=Dendrothele bispora (strain CBS 962.96) TaxID=1314807 RepID=A0A4S8M3Y7_DENBC|nr:hypothetical protein K435DRAFT_858150 [Dendrothele bispora CBS 962.96]
MSCPETFNEDSIRFTRRLADDLKNLFPNRSVPSFSSSANSDLPSGAFVATNPVAIVDLADFLEADDSKDVKVTHLLLSDSNPEDVMDNWGIINVNELVDDRETVSDIEIMDKEEDARCFNRKLSRRYRRLAKDHSTVVGRILKRVSSTLEVLSYLAYMPEEWKVVRSRKDANDPIDIYRDESTVISELFTLEFPVLRQVSLREKVLWRTEKAHCEDPFSYTYQFDFPSLPSLTHLYIAQTSSSGNRNGKIPSLALLQENLPSLSHVRFTATGLPEELQKKYEPYRGWIQETYKEIKNWWNPPPSKSSPIPPGLTVLYEPSCPWRHIGGFCATSDVEYDMFLMRLGRIASDFTSDFHLIWPSERDYLKYGKEHGLFPPDRALEDFWESLIVPGDDGEIGRGEWKLPEEKPWETHPQERWWRFDQVQLLVALRKN